MRRLAGERVDFVVTFLAMDARPAYPHPHLAPGPAAATQNTGVSST